MLLSPFGPRGDPFVAEARSKHLLGTLQYANVDVQVGAETKKSSDLFESCDHQDVLDYLSAKTADELNDLGCAYAWARLWGKATANLTASREKADADTAKDRATANLAVVTAAKAVATS